MAKEKGKGYLGRWFWCRLRHDCKVNGMFSYMLWYFALNVRNGSRLLPYEAEVG